MISQLLRVVLLFGTLGLVASSGAADTAYDRGVRAFQLRNYALARQQWEISAAQGGASAKNNLGYLLYEGLGGEIDLTRAVSLWRQAAQVGHPEAQWHLAQALEHGKGIRADKVQAYGWYRCALVSAEFMKGTFEYLEDAIAVDARNSVTELQGRLNKVQLESVEPMVKRCADTHVAARARTEHGVHSESSSGEK